ncbi:MAG: ammonium transporter [bacterium]|nr:ammonium transporter [bacterium]MCP5071265.1 ammonium transporter [bacterium]
MLSRLHLLAPFLTLLIAAPALAEGALDTGDTAWILASTALVLFMTLPGLALFYGGLVRTKNVLSVLMQCLALAAVITVIWTAFGYSLAFAEGGALIGGFEKSFLRGITPDTLSGTIPEVLFFVFQMTFAIITPALMVGAFAERMKFSAMMWFCVLWLVVVYLPICHMTWGGGWFGELGVFDFAGGIVVHITAGVGALVACIVIGPRNGYPKTPMLPHNLTMCVTGTGMLWVGWYGFNGGSALGANGGAAMAAVVTQISAATAACTWMAIEWVRYGKPSVLGIATGAIAGLAAVTPASGYIGPVGGLGIGLASGMICYLASTTVKRRLGYDDSLDVFGVHGVGGFVGTLLAAVFASEIFGGNQGALSISSQFGIQFLAGTVTIVYTAAASWVILKGIDALIGLRVSDEDEIRGLDVSLHEERGYDY